MAVDHLAIASAQGQRAQCTWEPHDSTQVIILAGLGDEDSATSCDAVKWGSWQQWIRAL